MGLTTLSSYPQPIIPQKEKDPNPWCRLGLWGKSLKIGPLGCPDVRLGCRVADRLHSGVKINIRVVFTIHLPVVFLHVIVIHRLIGETLGFLGVTNQTLGILHSGDEHVDHCKGNEDSNDDQKTLTQSSVQDDANGHQSQNSVDNKLTKTINQKTHFPHLSLSFFLKPNVLHHPHPCQVGVYGGGEIRGNFPPCVQHL